MDEQKYIEKTVAIYGKLFSDYSDTLFESSVNLFTERHKRWGIDLSWFKGKTCLDAGCGGGRYLVALARLGAKSVVGIDISAQAISLANKRLEARKLLLAKAVEGSVLTLPFPDESFDYVVSSGVIHHTPDPYRALSELARVVRRGGKLFLSVYGKRDLLWIANDILRHTVCKIIRFETMNKILEASGVPANKRYVMLDNLYVPYFHRLRERDLRQRLAHFGFGNIRRVKFERYDYEKFLTKILRGEGWIQLYADKLY